MEKADNQWRDDFPVLNQMIYKKKLIYLDNAATSQMPLQVMERLKRHYEKEHANIHRGIHYLSSVSTEEVESVRDLAEYFLQGVCSDNLPDSNTGNGMVIFTAGTTDSINLLASAYRESLRPGQGIMTTQLEHHSNYVPWQQACKLSGANFYVCPSADGELDLDWMEQTLRTHTVALVAVAHVTNLTGTVNPIKTIVEMAHRYGADVLIDGAQGVFHRGVDVSEVGCDYYCFSGHKMLAPTGTGVLYGKKEKLEALKPVRYGGGMVDLVTQEKTTWASLPYCFEAGTPNIAGIIGLGEAIRYIKSHDFDAMRKQEDDLIAYLRKRLETIDGLQFLGHPKKQAGAVSFCIDNVHPFDLASIVDKYGVALRSGNLCAQPALSALGADKAIRISPAFYNTVEEIDVCVDVIRETARLLQRANFIPQYCG